MSKPGKRVLAGSVRQGLVAFLATRIKSFRCCGPPLCLNGIFTAADESGGPGLGMLMLLFGLQVPGFALIGEAPRWWR